MAIDLTGQIIGRWTVVGEAPPKRDRNRRWRCVCECGVEREVLGFTLQNGRSKSCGCLSAELASARGEHGLWGTPEYESWIHMLYRCYEPTSTYYARYGGRGIAVCDRWRESFKNFYNDMGPRPTPGHTLDRMDNDGPYSPENCRWATRKQQARNRSSARLLTHDGETLALCEWAERIGITANALYMRLSKGWSVEKALTYRGPRGQ